MKAPMKLTVFITDHLDIILAEWEAFAGTLEPAASQMSVLALRDHAKGILQAIVLDLATRQNAAEQLQKSQGLAPENEGIESAASVHGAMRHDSNFSLLQLSAEFRALRATVLRLWLPKVRGMSATATDDMVRFNEAIDQALAESIATYSARADHTRELFLAVLGHDLRAPLSTLSMAGQLLMDEQTPAAQVAPIGLRVERASRVMVRMVDDLIGYTRTQLGAGMPTCPGQTDIREVCEAAIEDASATHPGSVFETELSGELNGQFDAVRLHQLVTNLLINAVQYGGRDGPIKVRARSDAQAVTIEVLNRGRTIPAASLQSIFRPLIQLTAEGDDQRPRTSLGLGLFIAREIAVAHGGSIVVSSNDATGTTFTVRLPRTQ
ncbi:MAG: two-component sensor histidine kinase [Massilia sp.]|nr:two-component sensor histidine kinase [Massilia sp.]